MLFRSAPCVNTNKTKYAAIASYTGAISSAANNTRTTATATSGSLYLFIGSGVSGNAMLNSAGVYLIRGTGTNSWYPAINIGGIAQYVISVTNRKIVIIAPSTNSSSVNAIQAVLEFSETSATNLYNNVPFIFYHSYSMTTANSGGGNTLDTLSGSQLLYRLMGTPQWFRVIDGDRKSTRLNSSH